MSHITKYKSVIKNPNFLKLVGAHLLGQTAINMLHFTIALEIFSRTGSNLYVGLFLAVLSLPAIFFSYIGGLVADSFNRRRILYTVNAARVVLSLYILFVLDYPLLVLMGAFFVTVVNQFYVPAEGASIADIVRKENLFRANSIFAFIYYLSFLLGFSAAGPVLEYGGVKLVFYTVMIMYILALLLNVILPRLDGHLSDIRRRLRFNVADVGRRMKEGIDFMRSHKLIWLVVWIVAFIFSIERGVIALIPDISSRLFGFSVSEISYALIIPLAIGTVVGAVVANRLKYCWSKFRMIMTGLAIDGVGLLLLPFFHEASALIRGIGFTILSESSLIHLYVGMLAFLSGLADVIIIIATQTLIHHETNAATRGRVFGGLQSLLNLVGLPVIIGVSVVGGFSLRAFIGAAGALTLFVVLWSGIYYRLRIKKEYVIEVRGGD